MYECLFVSQPGPHEICTQNFTERSAELKHLLIFRVLHFPQTLRVCLLNIWTYLINAFCNKCVVRIASLNTFLKPFTVSAENAD